MRYRIIYSLLLLVIISPVYGQTATTDSLKISKLVPVNIFDSSIHLDIRYAGTNNFAKRAVYAESKAFLQQPAAEALSKVSKSLKSQGFGLLVFDGYRPWSVTKLFWEITPDDKKEFVSDPAKGSRHNRGCAVDLTLYELQTGKQVSMPSEYDEMNERAHPDYSGGTEEQRRLRDLLREAMEANGFKVYTNEWWHFDFNGWERYPIMDIPFSDIKTDHSGH